MSVVEHDVAAFVVASAAVTEEVEKEAKRGLDEKDADDADADEGGGGEDSSTSMEE